MAELRRQSGHLSCVQLGATKKKTVAGCSLGAFSLSESDLLNSSALPTDLLRG